MSGFITEDELTDLIRKIDLDSSSSEKKAEHPNRKPSAKQHDGSIEIANNHIIIRDPQMNGAKPTIAPSEHVKIKVNQQWVDEPTKVCSTDTLEWELNPPPLFEIVVSEDKLQAYLHVKSLERFEWRLKNQMPLKHLILAFEEDKNSIVETVDLFKIMSELEKMKITANVDLPAIQTELANPSFTGVLVAAGKAPVPSEDASLEIYFSEQLENQFFEISGSIDYRNHLKIPSVKRGEVIAKKIPAKVGIPGYDVYGNVVVPNAPKDILIIAKKDVQLREDGILIALNEGRPRVTGPEKIKTFDISRSFVIPGNVDIETGNIVFSGDVIVYGDITDNMIVESLGNVYVYGSIYNATVTATGSIFAKGNVMGSKLYSGYFGVLFNRLYQCSNVLKEQYSQMIEASKLLIAQLGKKSSGIRYGQIMLLLMENKFRELPKITKELMTVISNIQHIKKDEYQQLINMVECFLSPPKLIDTMTPGRMQLLHSLMSETSQEVSRMQEARVFIQINQCHNCELKSNGDIILQRDGVLLSELYSSGNIVFKNPQAVCRGSNIVADGSIAASVVGGHTGASSMLKAKKKIHINELKSGRICIQNYCVDIHEPVKHASFDKNTIRSFIQ